MTIIKGQREKKEHAGKNEDTGSILSPLVKRAEKFLSPAHKPAGIFRAGPVG